MAKYPTSIVHYTSLDVLNIFLNTIINNNGNFTVHLSHLNMTNDNEEGSYILKKYFTNSRSKQEIKKQWESEYLINNQPFIFSVIATDRDSKDKGSLPMWKMYGGDLKGCLLRFNWIKIKDFCKSKGYTFSDCKYLSSGEVDKKIKDLNKIKDIKSLFPELIQTSAFTKKICWKYENEWRILVNAKQDEIQIKNTNRGVIEYFELELPVEFIEEICLGPLVNADITMKSLTDFKHKLSMQFPGKIKFKITSSSISIR